MINPGKNTSVLSGQRTGQDASFLSRELRRDVARNHGLAGKR
jgi:hypothetical protein